MVEYLQRREGARIEVKIKMMKEKNLLSDCNGEQSHESDKGETHCSSCGNFITGEIYTDRFYEVLCRGCLLRLHKI